MHQIVLNMNTSESGDVISNKSLRFKKQLRYLSLAAISYSGMVAFAAAVSVIDEQRATVL